MGERLRAVTRAIQTTWGLVTVALLLLSVVVALVSLSLALRSSQHQLDNLQVESKCRSESAVALEAAESLRDDALADLNETIGRLFDASIRRDTEAIQFEGANLAPLSTQIHAATEAVRLARDERVASVDACTKG